MNSTAPTADTTAQMADRLRHLPTPVLLFIAARVKTLGLSLAPVAAGTWLTAQSGDWNVAVMVAAMVAAASIQIGTNLWNDGADGGRGTDGPDRLGPPRMTGLGLLDAALVRRAAMAAFATAALFGLWLTMIGGWPVILIGLNTGQRRTIMVEASLQNVAVAMFVAGSLLKNPALATPALIYALVMNISALVQISMAHKRAVSVSGT